MLTLAPALALRGPALALRGLANRVLKALRKARPLALLRASLMALYWGFADGSIMQASLRAYLKRR